MPAVGLWVSPEEISTNSSQTSHRPEVAHFYWMKCKYNSTCLSIYCMTLKRKLGVPWSLRAVAFDSKDPVCLTPFPSLFVGDDLSGLNDLTEDDLPERETYLDMAGEDAEGGRLTNSSRKNCNHKDVNEFISVLNGTLPVTEHSDVSSIYFSTQQHCTPFKFADFPHLFHFTTEEILAAKGIDREPFPEMGLESLQDSYSSSGSSHRFLQRSKPVNSEGRPVGIFAGPMLTNQPTESDTEPPKPSTYCHEPKDAGQCSPEASLKHHSVNPPAADCSRSSTYRAQAYAAQLKESRWAPLPLYSTLQCTFLLKTLKNALTINYSYY